VEIKQPKNVISKRQNYTGLNVRNQTMEENKNLRDYQKKLLEELQDPEEAEAYLNAALSDDDPRVFLLALKNVIEAQNQSMATLARKAKLNRENLYRMLSKKGNPKISSIIPVLNALGLQLAVQPYKHK